MRTQGIQMYIKQYPLFLKATTTGRAEAQVEFQEEIWPG